MAKKVSKGNKKANGGPTGRAKPVAAKSGFTRNAKRRYGCGGILK